MQCAVGVGLPQSLGAASDAGWRRGKSGRAGAITRVTCDGRSHLSRVGLVSRTSDICYLQLACFQGPVLTTRRPLL